MSANEGMPARRRRGPKVDAEGASAEARRLAAVILEVLSGERGPSEAARAAGMSCVRYLAAESRALRGLLTACEPARRGRKPASGECATLRAEVERLRKQCARQQALLRVQQRALGVAATPAGKKKRRKPRRRTLKLIDALRPAEAPPAEA